MKLGFEYYAEKLGSIYSQLEDFIETVENELREHEYGDENFIKMLIEHARNSADESLEFYETVDLYRAV